MTFDLILAGLVIGLMIWSELDNPHNERNRQQANREYLHDRDDNS